MKQKRFSTQTITLDGRRVRYLLIPPGGVRAGQAAIRLPLLLLHGLACSANAWGPPLRWLASQGLDQPVHAPDMPGCGHSAGPPEALGMQELADWAARLLDALGIARAHVAGNSMGCQVALALARRHPLRVGGVVLAGPTTGDLIVPPWRYLCGLIVDALREPTRYNTVLLRMYLQMGVRRYVETARKMLEDDPLAQAGAVTAPCLIVRGEFDSIVPEAAALRLAAALPRGAYAAVSGAAHAVQCHQPRAFTRILLAFLADVAAMERAEAGQRLAQAS